MPAVADRENIVGTGGGEETFPEAMRERVSRFWEQWGLSPTLWECSWEAVRLQGKAGDGLRETVCPNPAKNLPSLSMVCKPQDP